MLEKRLDEWSNALYDMEERTYETELGLSQMLVDVHELQEYIRQARLLLDPLYEVNRADFQPGFLEEFCYPPGSDRTGPSVPVPRERPRALRSRNEPCAPVPSRARSPTPDPNDIPHSKKQCMRAPDYRNLFEAP